jgi:phospholipid-binding lipoprotein MlaA
MRKTMIVLAALFVGGCATLPPGHQADPRDPWERFNRASYAFNDRLDRAVTKPAAKVYKKVTPQFLRQGFSNFFSNLNGITTILNDALQGKMGQAGRDTARFLLNTTIGLGGFFDPATAAGLEQNNEDFGQTLGKWGVKSGPYLMLPILGPSTLRDTVGRIPDQFSNPMNYYHDPHTRYGVRALDFLEMRAGLLDLEPQLEQSYDRYAFIRNAVLQRREFQVTDGNMPDESAELEAEFADDPAEPAAGETPAPQPEGASPPPGS